MENEAKTSEQGQIVDGFHRRAAVRSAEWAIARVHPDDAMPLAVSIIRGEASRDHVPAFAQELRRMAGYLEHLFPTRAEAGTGEGGAE
jgi:hypothetical protein